MLKVYRNKTLQWVQASVLEDFNFDLMADDTRLLTYRLARPLRFETVIEGQSEHLAIAPSLRQRGWVITGLGGQPIAQITGLLGRTGRFTTADGSTYSWEALNFLGTRRVFRTAQGGEVLRVDGTTWTLKAGAALSFGPANVNERDLTMLSGLAVHMMVIERYIAAVMIIIAAFGLLLLA
jgi:hypothetical protein